MNDGMTHGWRPDLVNGGFVAQIGYQRGTGFQAVAEEGGHKKLSSAKKEAIRMLCEYRRNRAGGR